MRAASAISASSESDGDTDLLAVLSCSVPLILLSIGPVDPASLPYEVGAFPTLIRFRGQYEIM